MPSFIRAVGTSAYLPLTLGEHTKAARDALRNHRPLPTDLDRGGRHSLQLRCRTQVIQKDVEHTGDTARPSKREIHVRQQIAGNKAPDAPTIRLVSRRHIRSVHSACDLEINTSYHQK
ncbi:hypothetical protein CVA01_29180 [Corynebacterium variabile]|uniref:Uncharacterized protein n=1 Tax=Corynebacterium variabile TaxID=1727 RepID=A0A4Y4C852_9CORY|nr:hypothetical protein CVA01_29180 [Corynebacterium variabile]